MVNCISWYSVNMSPEMVNVFILKSRKLFVFGCIFGTLALVFILVVLVLVIIVAPPPAQPYHNCCSENNAAHDRHTSDEAERNRLDRFVGRVAVRTSVLCAIADTFAVTVTMATNASLYAQTYLFLIVGGGGGCISGGDGRVCYQIDCRGCRRGRRRSSCCCTRARAC